MLSSTAEDGEIEVRISVGWCFRLIVVGTSSHVRHPALPHHPTPPFILSSERAQTRGVMVETQVSHVLPLPHWQSVFPGPPPPPLSGGWWDKPRGSGQPQNPRPHQSVNQDRPYNKVSPSVFRKSRLLHVFRQLLAKTPLIKITYLPQHSAFHLIIVKVFLVSVEDTVVQETTSTRD
uniref:Uncharacterized protein n=1 Tax=Timema monikensis TaxID=170555 RepID=A0A7R9EKW6_9NEOP|nr:unnamed protein product [Timema monikensis]